MALVLSRLVVLYRFSLLIVKLPPILRQRLEPRMHLYALCMFHTCKAYLFTFSLLIAESKPLKSL